MQTVVELLKSSSLLRKVPDEKLAALGTKLKPVPLGDGAVLFEEGSQGKGMYFVSEGKIRISKKAAGGASKDLAILAAGECFGEMELVGGAARSASASAVGATVVFELQRDDMNGWLSANPEQGLTVYSELAQIQTTRLRRTSDELALLFDLSNLILERHKTAKELLGKALAYIAPHLEGEWSAAAFLHNPYSEETEQAAVFGGLDAAAYSGRLPGPKTRTDAWLDERAFYAVLPGEKAPWGFLLFQSKTAQPEQQRRNTSRVLAAAARLLAAAVENINFQTEEALRARLKSQTYGPGI